MHCKRREPDPPNSITLVTAQSLNHLDPSSILNPKTQVPYNMEPPQTRSIEGMQEIGERELEGTGVEIERA